ncbi:glycerophosphodiester phosphodiesterase family protein [Pedobacter gandavensis]|uniref:glycerophosphodiester phosphodiesterase family protein n=1 Tax=Pedobacter TaxID=84567 RepID=UPI001C994FC1|nr:MULTISPECIES: glycerophosphodiester phosphodiesterase family protein [Pedobacter]WGQ11941.1 glycerophosphodiester phosphodiesterase family protein [Pedobacter gandavensis]
MKQFNLLLVGFLMLAVSCTGQTKNYISFSNGEELRSFLNRKTPGYPLISAHRGGPMKGFPENCIATFENATKYQPVVIEFDVALSKDSVLVIMHDDRLDRTSTGTGMIGDYTYAELQKLQLKDDYGTTTPYKIPTLNEVLVWGKGKVLFTIDVKKGVPFSKIIAEVRKTKSESNSIVITYNDNQAVEVHHLAPDLMISASVKYDTDLERLNSKGVPNNRIVAFVGTSVPEQKVFQGLHEKGITCIMGTMGNLDKRSLARPNGKYYYQYLVNGADMISTDNLELAGKEFDQYRKDKKIRSSHIKKVK